MDGSSVKCDEKTTPCASDRSDDDTPSPHRFVSHGLGFGESALTSLHQIIKRGFSAERAFDDLFAT
jgi:hypothetical protein